MYFNGCLYNVELGAAYNALSSLITVKYYITLLQDTLSQCVNTFEILAFYYLILII